jgi:hypothetical protein
MQCMEDNDRGHCPHHARRQRQRTATAYREVDLGDALRDVLEEVASVLALHLRQLPVVPAQAAAAVRAATRAVEAVPLRVCLRRAVVCARVDRDSGGTVNTTAEKELEKDGEQVSSPRRLPHPATPRNENCTQERCAWPLAGYGQRGADECNTQTNRAHVHPEATHRHRQPRATRAPKPTHCMHVHDE